MTTPNDRGWLNSLNLARIAEEMASIEYPKGQPLAHVLGLGYAAQFLLMAAVITEHKSREAGSGAGFSLPSMLAEMQQSYVKYIEKGARKP